MAKKRLLKNGHYTISEEKDGDTRKILIEVSNLDVAFFRYRSINDNNLNALLNDEFWASHPSTFNDPYDVFLTYNRKQLFNKFVENKKKKNEEIIDDDFLERLYNNLMTNTMKKSQYIACFSEKVDNPAMWAHYSQNGTGFAIEYSYDQINNIRFDYYESYLHYMFKEILGEIKEEHIDKLNYLHTFFLPVMYSNKTYDYTKTLFTYIEKYDDMFLNSTQEENKQFLLDFLESDRYQNEKNMMTTISITKNTYWKYEREWRLVVTSFDFMNNHKQLNYTVPKGIYLGEFISGPHKLLLCSIAYNKKIPIYQMYTRHTTQTNKLAYKEITEKEVKNILNL